MGDLDKQMWATFVSKLSGQAEGLNPDEFLPTTGMTLADWEAVQPPGATDLPTTTPRRPGERIIPGLRLWADMMPVWKPTYQPGSSFHNNYLAFLESIEIPGGDPELRKKARQARKQMNKAREELVQLESDVVDGWLEFAPKQKALPKQSRQTFQMWFSRRWASSISTAEANLAAADVNYRKVLREYGGPDAEAIARARSNAVLNPNAGNALTDPDTGLMAPYYAITPSLNEWFTGVVKGEAEGSPVDFEIDFSRERETTKEDSFFVKTSLEAGYMPPFSWGGTAAVSYEQSDKKTEYSHFLENMSMRYQAQAVNVFTVAQPPWYQSNTIQQFRDRIDPESALGGQELFGPGGFLNLRPNLIFVVYKPRVTLTGSTKQVDALTTAATKQGGGSVSVGSMGWGVKASASGGTTAHEASMTKSSDGSSVTIEDTTGLPKVLGVVPLRLGEVETAPV